MPARRINSGIKARLPTFMPMAGSEFEIIKDIIINRRSVSWKNMNGRLIENETVNQLLELAHWAPTHGRTEPWQFFVYAGEALKQFGQDHADLYWQHTADDKRQESKYEKLKQNVAKTSHLVIAVMKRGSNPKIAQIEEIAAASAAIQNILLGASALGIASFWSTGGMTHHPALKQMLGLGTEDIVLGLIFLGYTDEPVKQGMRNATVSEKVKWL